MLGEPRQFLRFLETVGKPVLDVVLHPFERHGALRKPNGTRKKITHRISNRSTSEKV